MTNLIFLEDPYLKTLTATVTAVGDDGGVELDRTIFFATGGGQPGDTGSLTVNGQTLAITDTIKGDSLDQIRHMLADGAPRPAVGDVVEIALDWDRRYRHMRMHTLMHLVLAAIPVQINGCQIGAEKSRIDMVLPDGPPDKDALQAQLNEMIAANHPVSQSYISEAELAQNPELVRTMAVAPPSLNGKIRLVTIGDPAAPIDAEPCGGTHVAGTAEVGEIILGKIENKGRNNRRINLRLAE